ncbi:hypothetical protein [Actinopolymorpha rutila]|uniref:Uncharacterized protein n=1 Tax=Actinopolymorpha rutila TaxID=446787 RepID=A0A852ZQE0_9ACTN|nr:hypothetical protein [Actinopolymorpha rutila]NYH91240.1 hypothetical protein [Actinopolymorpha rutila]
MTGRAEHPDRPREPGRDLAEELGDLGYLELFQRFDENALDHVWRRPDASEALRQLALHPGTASVPRFLAAEVLFTRDPTFPAPGDRGVLASLYAEALRQNMTRMANPWGLPGDLAAPVASHVLALGDAAVPAFAALLDDSTQLRYSGSQEATYGNSYDYRVKDEAAELIAELIGVPYPVHLNPDERDAQIDLLRQRLS